MYKNDKLGGKQMPLYGTETFMRYIRGRRPDAIAEISGSEKYSALSGEVDFYDTGRGTLVVVEVHNLPLADADTGRPLAGVHGFHIHEGESCLGDTEDPFADAGSHYDRGDSPHPEHSGDMPPLFSNKGYAYMCFYSTRFRVQEVVGRAVIIHKDPDDFKTQPSGASGEKIACGIIRRNLRI